MDSIASSSSASSSSDSPITFYVGEKCRVCSQTANGKHFGAVSCRACSAFFRRAVIGNFERFKCLKVDEKCRLKLNGRYGCKKCRLQKCYEAGMSVEKLQFDHDLLSSTEQFLRTPRIRTKIPHSPENFLGRPSFIFSCEPDLATSNKTLIDVQFLIDYAANLFISNSEPRRNAMLAGMSTLDRLSYALDLSKVPSTEKPIVCNKIGKKETLVFYEHKFLATANWLTYCDEFQQLDQTMKIEFLKAIWFVWMKVEKIGKAAEKRMAEGELDTICHSLNNVYIDIDKIEMETSWMSNYDSDQLQLFLDKPSRIYKNNIVEPLMDLRASPQEITYLISVVSFRYAAKQHGGEIAEVAEKLIDILANDLHNYYFKELKLLNYASRLARLMKIVQFVEQDTYERKQRAEIARIFDIFTIEFSHPEMFIGV